MDIANTDQTSATVNKTNWKRPASTPLPERIVMNENFFLLYLNVMVNSHYLNLGAGIYLPGYSFDEGQNWYVFIDGQLIPEEVFALEMQLRSTLACAAGFM